jgi:uncharacterized protein YjbI with pentapeptide repeats
VNGARFAGKAAFGSTGPEPVRYLTTAIWKGGPTPIALPAMSAPAVTAGQRCLLYRTADDSVRVQLGDLSWIGLHEELGWLVSVGDQVDAVPLVLSGDPAGSLWQARTSRGQWATVGYALAASTPLLTINGGDLTAFAPQPLTPSLDAIVASGTCRAGDLSFADLAGADLSRTDLTGADLSAADLTGAILVETSLVQADLTGATLTGINLTGADLSRACLARTRLDGVSWGSPRRAPGIDLTGSSARSAVLGGEQPLDCTGARLSLGDFTGADLRHLMLTDADLSGATLVGAVLDHADLTRARLHGVVAPRASLRSAVLQGCSANGARLAGADLSGADLTRARLGARTYLFTLAASFATELDTLPFPQPDLAAAFQAAGVTVGAQDGVTVLAPGSRWQIVHAGSTYRLVEHTGQAIDVFTDPGDLGPACLALARCAGATGSRADLAGADLRGIRWFGGHATLDHADLTGADLSGALLTGVNLTQAYLDGADLSGAVLVQAVLRGCLVGAGGDGRALCLDGAWLQGVDLADSTLVSALLVDAAVATTSGVPLFTLPAEDSADLTTTGIGTLRPSFAAAGYPLGSAPTVASNREWRLDNGTCPDLDAPRGYLVRRSGGRLCVSATTGGAPLFWLPGADEAWLADPVAGPRLVSAFTAQGYALVAGAPLGCTSWREVTVGPDAPFGAPASYPVLRVEADGDRLRVYGSVLVRLRDWQDVLPSGLAFGPTRGLERALDAAGVGPSGLPHAYVPDRVSWPDFLTALSASAASTPGMSAPAGSAAG